MSLLERAFPRSFVVSPTERRYPPAWSTTLTRDGNTLGRVSFKLGARIIAGSTVVVAHDLDVRAHYGTGGQRQGHGSELLHTAVQTARRYGAARIEGVVSDAHLSLQPWLPDFYQKNGFSVLRANKGDHLILKAL